MQRAADEGYLAGRVLDYGCGTQPYRYIVKAAGGEYLPYDRAEFGGNVSGEDIGELPMVCDSILCTQVVQYVEDVYTLLAHSRNRLRAKSGVLVMTYPTNWPEVELEDLHRFTKAGMEHLLTGAGFEILVHERRAELVNRDGTWALGYGVICRA